jgi:hypothetical protein
MANEFWLSDAQWAAIDPLLPKNRPGARRVDDRRVISHRTCAKDWLSLAGLSLVLWPADDDLQPPSTMVGARPLAEAVSSFGNINLR